MTQIQKIDMDSFERKVEFDHKHNGVFVDIAFFEKINEIIDFINKSQKDDTDRETKEV